MRDNPAISMHDENDILEIEDLKVMFPSPCKMTSALDGVSLSVEKGKILGLVGESGSGKSVTSLEILGLNAKAEVSGSIRFRRKDGSVMDILRSDRKEKEAIRGSEIAMIFQEPGSALNPVLRIGKQLERVIRLHDKSLDKDERKEKALALLGKAGLRDIGKIYSMYPHELSGGMKQRVVIAMALSAEPVLILADEPTTALDVTIEREILKLLKDLVAENGVSMILISHDLGVISEVADSIAIMKNGRILEEGLKDEILSSPIHPYTRSLLDMARNMESILEGDGTIGKKTGNLPDPSLCPLMDACHKEGRTCPDSTEHIQISRTHRVSCLGNGGDE